MVNKPNESDNANYICQETDKTEDVIAKAAGDDEDVDPFGDYENWGEKDTRQPGQEEKEAGTVAPSQEVVPKRGKGGKPFTPEQVKKLRDLASKQAANIIIARNHYADPKKNPRMHREAQLHSAHEAAFAPMHDAWSELSDSDSYRKASLPQKYRMQRDFINQWHQDNPEHYPAAMNAIHSAHEKGGKADLAHTQEEKRRLEHASMGGGLGDMTSQEAAAHLGSKAEDDEAPQANTMQSAGVKFAGSNPEAVKQALASKRFEDVPSADVDVEEMQGRAPVKKHPDFEHPENKALINDFAGRYTHLMNQGFIDKLKEGLGAKGSQVDDAAVSDAAHNAMWMAMHQYNASRSNMPLDSFIKNRMVDAIKNNIKQQHTEQVTASAKRAAKQIKPEDPARTAGLKIYSPDEKAAFQAKVTGQPAVAPVPAVPVPASVTTPAPVAQQPDKPHFSTHLDDAAKERLQNVGAAKTIRRPGGTK